ncbi:PREDICTED: uncharacterized protein LOC101292375 [Fragaria vesca subsp. vesca]
MLLQYDNFEFATSTPKRDSSCIKWKNRSGGVDKFMGNDRSMIGLMDSSHSKKEDDAADKTKEAADAVKDGAKEVRETCEFMRDTVETTAKTMGKATKQATEKVTETAETITDKTKGTVSGAWGMAKNTTEIIKDKVMGK